MRWRPPQSGVAKRRFGKETEERFFRALEQRTNRTPNWFIRTERVGWELDRKGVDAVAIVESLDHTKRERVPMQIKSSWTGFRKYRLKRVHLPEFMVVLIIVIRPWDSAETIRYRAYKLLAKVRDRRRRFAWFYTFLKTLRWG